jgi:tRNA (cmo5U34)-methyltransferase
VRTEDNLFTGRIGEEYHFLETMCPNAALLPRKLGDYIDVWAGAGDTRLRGFEIGCGTGVSTLPLLSQCARLDLLAVDSSARMLDQARVNLADWSARERVTFIEADALDCLKGQETASFDVVASNYAIHNFKEDYRRRVLAEAFRVLRPGGLFINGDRYAIDDRAEHLALTQATVRHWFAMFGAMQRYDLLEDWVTHFFSDESEEHIMWLTPALKCLADIGFDRVRAEYRDGVDTLVSALKPA